MAHFHHNTALSELNPPPPPPQCHVYLIDYAGHTNRGWSTEPGRRRRRRRRGRGRGGVWQRRASQHVCRPTWNSRARTSVEEEALFVGLFAGIRHLSEEVSVALSLTVEDNDPYGLTTPLFIESCSPAESLNSERLIKSNQVRLH